MNALQGGLPVRALRPRKQTFEALFIFCPAALVVEWLSGAQVVFAGLKANHTPPNSKWNGFSEYDT